MRSYSSIIAIIFLVLSCKTKPMNQKVNKEREGLWIEEYSEGSLKYKSKGKYHKGDPIKKWSYFLNGKIIIKENYKGDYCIRTRYHQNGRIESKGKTKLNNDEKYAHWFYTGDWKFYNEKGKPTLLKKYHNGELISETVLLPPN